MSLMASLIVPVLGHGNTRNNTEDSLFLQCIPRPSVAKIPSVARTMIKASLIVSVAQPTTEEIEPSQADNANDPRASLQFQDIPAGFGSAATAASRSASSAASSALW